MMLSRNKTNISQIFKSKTYNKFSLLKKSFSTKSNSDSNLLEAIPKSFTDKVNTVKNNFKYLEHIFPHSLNSNLKSYINFSNISTTLSFDDKETSSSLTEGLFKPGWDILLRNSKLWRPSIGLCVSEAYNDNRLITEESYYKLLFLIEIFHNASLIIDDIEDQSENRRGKPCVHKIYGESLSINSGISMFYVPYYKFLEELYQELNNSNIISFEEKNKIINKLNYYYFQELTAIHLGQGMDIEMKFKRLPKTETYYDVVLCKSGVFPRVAVKWVLTILDTKEFDNKSILNDYISLRKNDFSDLSLFDCSNLFEDNNNRQKDLFGILPTELELFYSKLVDHLSIAFQIKDDLLNITPSYVAKSKGMLGEDIYEGKQSIMVLHSLNKGKIGNEKEKVKANRLYEILKKGTKDNVLINEAIEIMTDLGSIKYSEDSMCRNLDLVIDMCNYIKKYCYNPKGIDNLVDLSNYLVKRSNS